MISIFWSINWYKVDFWKLFLELINYEFWCSTT